MSVAEQNNQTSKKIVVTHHLRQKNKPLGSFLSVPDFQLPILHFDLNVLWAKHKEKTIITNYNH